MKNKKKQKSPASRKQAGVRPQLNMRVHPNVITVLHKLQKSEMMIKELKGHVSYPSLVAYALQFIYTRSNSK